MNREQTRNCVVVAAFLLVAVGVAAHFPISSEEKLGHLRGWCCDAENCSSKIISADECHHKTMNSPERCSYLECLFTAASFAHCPEDFNSEDACPMKVDPDALAFVQLRISGDFYDQCKAYYDHPENPWCFTIYHATKCDPFDQDFEGRCKMPDGGCYGYVTGELRNYNAIVCDNQ